CCHSAENGRQQEERHGTGQETVPMSGNTHAAYRSFGGLDDAQAKSIAAELATIAGADRVLVGDAARRQHPGDQSWLTFIHAHFGKPLNRPDVVVTPTTTAQVSAIMKLATRLRVPVTPVGGASGVQGAANANCGGILLDLSAMTRIRALDR